MPPAPPTDKAGAPARPSRKLVGALLFFGALGVTGTAAYLYLRRQQKHADAQTHDRLAPRAPRP